MTLTIPRCYDSHIHFFGTGEFKNALNLRKLFKKRDLFSLKVSAKNFRGDCLIGFGWDENHWEADLKMERFLLDEAFPDFPVYFVRADGHAVWVNTRFLTKFTTKKNKLTQSGLFVEESKAELAAHLPPFSQSQLEAQALAAQKLFLAKGFSHLRDMGSRTEEWSTLKALDRTGKLTVFLELNYESSTIAEVRENLRWLRKKRSEQNKHLRPVGIKIYYDGSLGSETALLSKPYFESRKKGIRLWTKPELQKIIELVWRADFELAVHTLGDLAVHEVLVQAQKVHRKMGKGRRILNLEHVEVLSQKSLPLLRELNVRCHLQPSHFLDDKIWLQKKLGPDYVRAFPWRILEKNCIEFYFGSDCPISAPDLKRTRKALREAKKFGIPPLQEKKWWKRHIHPDSNWGALRKSYFKFGQ